MKYILPSSTILTGYCWLFSCFCAVKYALYTSIANQWVKRDTGFSQSIISFESFAKADTLLEERIQGPFGGGIDSAKQV